MQWWMDKSDGLFWGVLGSGGFCCATFMFLMPFFFVVVRKSNTRLLTSEQNPSEVPNCGSCVCLNSYFGCCEDEQS